MKNTQKRSLTAAALLCALAVTAHAGESKEEKQEKIRKMAQDTLQQLYEADPNTKAVIKGAAGYAVFSDLGVKILLAGSGNGQGIAVNNKTKAETFMKMIEVQAGLGMGVKKFRVVFVFENPRAHSGFINSGWEFGGQTTAAAKDGDKVERWLDRCRFRRACGCINSPKRDWLWRSLARAPSITKTTISIEVRVWSRCPHVRRGIASL
jgi:hypothetical protein